MTLHSLFFWLLLSFSVNTTSAQDAPEIALKADYNFSIPTFQEFVPAKISSLELGESIPVNSGGDFPEIIAGSEKFWIFRARKGTLTYGHSTWPISCVRIHKLRQLNPQQPHVYEVSFSAQEGSCSLNESDLRIRLKMRISDFVLGQSDKAWAKLYDLETEMRLY